VGDLKRRLRRAREVSGLSESTPFRG
jgi:hypothetical protein